MHIYAYQNSVANVAKPSIHIQPAKRRVSRNVDTNKLGTAVYLTVYGTLALIDVIAVGEAFVAIASLIGA